MTHEEASRRRLAGKVYSVPGMVTTVSGRGNIGLLLFLKPDAEPLPTTRERFASVLPATRNGWHHHWYTRPVGKLVMVADSADFAGLVVITTERDGQAPMVVQ